MALFPVSLVAATVAAAAEPRHNRAAAWGREGAKRLWFRAGRSDSDSAKDRRGPRWDMPKGDAVDANAPARRQPANRCSFPLSGDQP